MDHLWITLDTLRHDVAVAEWEAGATPFFNRLIPAGWERRHTPGSFTFAAHMAFFAGFWPTPAAPGPHPRRLALAFPGSETINGHTRVFHAPDLLSGLRSEGYHTHCIGGTGFFNPASALGGVLPGLFDTSEWHEHYAVTHPHSTHHQVDAAIRAFAMYQPLVCFINVSAIHQPNSYHLPGNKRDTVSTHAAALRYVDIELERLFMSLRRDTSWILCSDHGTCYGEDGLVGHRLAHPHVWTVPYAEGVWRV